MATGKAPQCAMATRSNRFGGKEDGEERILRSPVSGFDFKSQRRRVAEYAESFSTFLSAYSAPLRLKTKCLESIENRKLGVGNISGQAAPLTRRAANVIIPALENHFSL